MSVYGRIRGSKASTSRGVAIVTLAVCCWFGDAMWSLAADRDIEGRYLQNRPCRGDSSDPANLKVIISTGQITYAGGICSIDSRRDEGQTTLLQVTCRFRSGKSLGAEISLARGHDDLVHMIQQGGGFEADLYRCP